MIPSGFQVPPRPPVTGARVCGAPPPRSSRFSAAPAKNPTERLSGDQKGRCAFCTRQRLRRRPPAIAARDGTRHRRTPRRQSAGRRARARTSAGRSGVGVNRRVRHVGRRRRRFAQMAQRGNRQRDRDAPRPPANTHASRLPHADAWPPPPSAARPSRTRPRARGARRGCRRRAASRPCAGTRSAWLTRAGTVAGSAAQSGSLAAPSPACP